MTQTYSLRDAQAWAAFSGDYNPIHFDPAAARKWGMSGLCVHGMRAMLDMKDALSAALENQRPATQGVVFTSRLREPVVCGMPYALPVCSRVRLGQPQVSGTLLNEESHHISFSSTLAGTTEVTLSPQTQKNTLSGEELGGLYLQFLAVKGTPGPQWSFLDAVLFRQLVKAPATLETVRALLPDLKAASLREVFHQVQVVQTHHETHFSPDLLSVTKENIRFEGIDYAVTPTLVMGEKETGLIMRVGLQAWRGDVPLMTVAVTLKTGPLAAV